MTEIKPSDRACVHIWVTGRVQGVGFRAFVQQRGLQFGLTGWVRNVGRDQVETLAEGPRPVLERFVDTVKAGPSASHVEESRVEWEAPTGEYRHFYVKYDLL